VGPPDEGRSKCSRALSLHRATLVHHSVRGRPGRNGSAGTAATRGSAVPRWTLPVTAPFAVAASALWALWRSNGHPVIIDEALYLFQANLLEHGKLSWTIPRSWEPFAAVRQAVTSDRTVYSQYPPGWPGMLTLWAIVAPSWPSRRCSWGVLVVSTMQVGRAVFHARAGVIAAALVPTSGLLLRWGGPSCQTFRQPLFGCRVCCSGHHDRSTGFPNRRCVGGAVRRCVRVRYCGTATHGPLCAAPGPRGSCQQQVPAPFRRPGTPFPRPLGHGSGWTAHLGRGIDL
jgi:hypothetical protein